MTQSIGVFEHPTIRILYWPLHELSKKITVVHVQCERETKPH